MNPQFALELGMGLFGGLNLVFVFWIHELYKDIDVHKHNANYWQKIVAKERSKLERILEVLND